MNKTIKNTIFITIVLSLLLYAIYLILFSSFVWKHSYQDWTVTPIASNSNFTRSFKFPINTFDMLGGWANIDSTKSLTANYLLRKTSVDSEKAFIVIGYMDYLSCFNPLTLTIEKQNIKRKKYGYVDAAMLENEVYVHVILPYFPFIATKLVPAGDHMIIKGLDTVSSRIIKHKNVTEYRYIGNFDQIGFTLNNTSWFKRNTSRRYVFYGQKLRQYGSLSIFIDQNDIRSFMIYYVKDAGKEGYDKHFPELEKALESMETYGCYGKAVDKIQKQ